MSSTQSFTPFTPQLQYHMEARVSIERTAWSKFDRSYPGGAGKKVIELLEGAGLQLKHSGVFEGDERYIHFYNLWELGPNANKLAEAEWALADKVLWARFVKLLDKYEDKDLCYTVSKTTQTKLPPSFNPNSCGYLRVQYDLAHYANSEFQARIEADLVATGREYGWLLGNTYQFHTGREGRVVQIWLVPGNLSLQHAQERIDAAPWCQPLRDGRPIIHEIDVQLLARSAFDHPLPQ